MDRVVHFGSYWQKDNDIIYSMVKDLSKVSNLNAIDTHLYDNKKRDFVVEDFSYDKNHPVNWIRNELVYDSINKHNPSIIVVNSGGMSIREETIKRIRNLGIKTIGISLSDPDVYPYNGHIYASYYDLFYTNSIFSIENQYKGKANILPFAASTDIHYPIDGLKRFDLVVVGSYRKDRVDIVRSISEKFNVGVYGSGWNMVGIKNMGEVNGIDHLKALNSGKIYLSFSRTQAGYNNVKVGLFEAAACKMCLITEDFPEIYNYFEKYKEVITYSNCKELMLKINGLLSDSDSLKRLSENSFERFIKDHTWEKRWTNILSKIE